MRSSRGAQNEVASLPRHPEDGALPVSAAAAGPGGGGCNGQGGTTDPSIHHLTPRPLFGRAPYGRHLSETVQRLGYVESTQSVSVLQTLNEVISGSGPLLLCDIVTATV